MTKKLFIKTYGCQMNVYDSIKMQELLAPFGFSITEQAQEADMVILNTCHIREKAADKMYSELGRMKQLKDARRIGGFGEMIIVVAGCVGQAEGEEIFARAPYVDIVVGPQSYHSLPELLAKMARSEKNLINLDFVEEAKFDHLSSELTAQGASAFVSVQEGCDKFCTFCVVPYTRGAEFSRKVEEVYRETMALAAKGAKEVYLLGQNVNAYHGLASDQQDYTLAELIEHLASISNIERIRYITSHPNDMTSELIQQHKTQPKLMPFLHLPVQSGSDRVLKNMNRKHSRAEYFAIIEAMKAARPDMALSSDFIVGFPGETDEDFADTMDLVKKVQYAQCFSFKYSPRPGTPAAARPQLPEQIKIERLAVLQQELQKQQMTFNEYYVGRILPVLFERRGKLDDQVTGKTPYMQSVYVKTTSHDLIGKIVNIKITKALLNGVEGQIADAA